MGALDIIKNKTLTYEQIVMNLAKEGENSLNVLNISEKAQKYRDEILALNTPEEVLENLR